MPGKPSLYMIILKLKFVFFCCFVEYNSLFRVKRSSDARTTLRVQITNVFARTVRVISKVVPFSMSMFVGFVGGKCERIVPLLSEYESSRCDPKCAAIFDDNK